MAESLNGDNRVAVIGAGYAGMAAAAELAARDIPVTVFEASGVLGGRARAVSITKAGKRITVDNGQHLLIGAYRETQRLMHLVGADPGQLLARLPLTLDFPGELAIRAPRLPAPMHLATALLSARGLNLAEKLTAIRFMRRLKKDRFQAHQEGTVTALLDRYGQLPRLRKFLWEPLCLAALNTPADAASAEVFVTVLQDSLGGASDASDLLLPRVDLGALFPDVAARYVERAGGRVMKSESIRHIAQVSGGFLLRSAATDHGCYAQLILAVAPYHLAPLIARLPELDELGRQIAKLSWEPIVTCYLAYPPAARLASAMQGHADGLVQWLFDRGQLGGPAGLFAAVISAHGQHQALSKEQLAARIHDEIAAVTPGLPAPSWSQVIAEKRATFACIPGLDRPATATAVPGLFLAGDYVASAYPATLESAVKSGVNAAKCAARLAVKFDNDAT